MEMVDLNKFKELILSGEEYREFIHKLPNPNIRTYVFDLTNKGKRLRFFGSSHITKPDDPIFDEIRKSFEEFKPEIAYMEGLRMANGPREDVIEEVSKKTLEEARSEGESFYTLKLAVDARIVWECPEPEYKDEVDYLLGKGFSKQDVFDYHMNRVLAQYQRQNEDPSIPDCVQYLQKYFDRLTKIGWDREEIDAMKNRLIKSLDFSNANRYADLSNPIPSPNREWTVSNEVSRSNSRYRDERIIDRLHEGLKKYDRAFIVYGYSHAIRQEPALKALFQAL